MSQNVYSVSALVHYIKQTLDNDIRIQSILIKGEISNFTNHRSGHWYFTAKGCPFQNQLCYVLLPCQTL